MVLATPAHSGAVLLLPFQVSVLGTPNPMVTRPAHPAGSPGPVRVVPAPVLMLLLAAVVRCVGGIYGIGGGSILAPILIGMGGGRWRSLLPRWRRLRDLGGGCATCNLVWLEQREATQRPKVPEGLRFPGQLLVDP